MKKNHDIEEKEIPEEAPERDDTDYSIRVRIRESTRDDLPNEIGKLVNKLANLQAERKVFEARADGTANQMGYTRKIDELIEELDQQIELRDSLRRPFEEEMAKIDEGIEDISSQIVHVWNPETMKKTMKFDVGMLTLRTTQSLDIKDPAILLDNLIAHFSTYRVANEFISGFKKTIVRQFIGMHPQDSSVAELVPKTTVKLEATK